MWTSDTRMPHSKHWCLLTCGHKTQGCPTANTGAYWHVNISHKDAPQQTLVLTDMWTSDTRMPHSKHWCLLTCEHQTQGCPTANTGAYWHVDISHKDVPQQTLVLTDMWTSETRRPHSKTLVLAGRWTSETRRPHSKHWCWMAFGHQAQARRSSMEQRMYKWTESYCAKYCLRNKQGNFFFVCLFSKAHLHQSGAWILRQEQNGSLLQMVFSYAFFFN